MTTPFCWHLPLNSPPTISLLTSWQIGRAGEQTRIVNELRDWAVVFIRGSGHLEFTRQGRLLPIEWGSVMVVPPKTPHVVHISGHWQQQYAHFQVVDAGGAEGRRDTESRLAAVMSLGKRFWLLEEQLLEAQRIYVDQPHRAEAALWHLLWTLVAETDHQHTQSAPGTSAAALQRVLQAIEIGLDRPLSIAMLAADAQTSYSSLNRLFQQQLGLGASTYLRARRVERARYLLENTDVPIKAVAAQVGIADLQLFNKTMRHAAGESPRRIRDGSHWRNAPSEEPKGSAPKKDAGGMIPPAS